LGELTALHQNLYLYLRGLLLRGVREKGRGEEGKRRK